MRDYDLALPYTKMKYIFVMVVVVVVVVVGFFRDTSVRRKMSSLSYCASFSAHLLAFSLVRLFLVQIIIVQAKTGASRSHSKVVNGMSCSKHGEKKPKALNL